jgi:hypothetical protein
MERVSIFGAGGKECWSLEGTHRAVSLWDGGRFSHLGEKVKSKVQHESSLTYYQHPPIKGTKITHGASTTRMERLLITVIICG